MALEMVFILVGDTLEDGDGLILNVYDDLHKAKSAMLDEMAELLSANKGEFEEWQINEWLEMTDMNKKIEEFYQIFNADEFFASFEIVVRRVF